MKPYDALSWSAAALGEADTSVVRTRMPAHDAAWETVAAVCSAHGVCTPLYPASLLS